MQKYDKNKGVTQYFRGISEKNLPSSKERSATSACVFHGKPKSKYYSYFK
jgi:hypothetical protein